MTDLTKIIFQAFLSGLFGLVFTSFASLMAVERPTLFWISTIFLWLIIGILNGYLLKTWKECLITIGIIGLFSLILLFLALLLLGIFSDAIIDIFNIAHLFTPEKVIGFAILFALIGTVILVVILMGSSIATFYIRKWYKESKGIHSTSDFEKDFYKDFERSESDQNKQLDEME
ncbi:MAG: hypothetical protein EAX90_05955 [Candidatus Heimdallarchaeota archaeon]|nr:hypothetical protein [Candidatus Heimdallarchaeota archaeon]